jgi:hypothetical protein
MAEDLAPAIAIVATIANAAIVMTPVAIPASAGPARS